eukprot:11860978-Karenia_brevis.AAC.1
MKHSEEEVPEKADKMTASDKKRLNQAIDGPLVPVDLAMMTEWAREFCIRDLQPVAMVLRPGTRTFCKQYLPGTSGKTKLQELVDNEIGRIKKCVEEKLKVAMATRCKFTIQADSWKPKMRHNRHHYGAALLTWISEH